MKRSDDFRSVQPTQTAIHSNPPNQLPLYQPKPAPIASTSASNPISSSRPLYQAPQKLLDPFEHAVKAWGEPNIGNSNFLNFTNFLYSF